MLRAAARPRPGERPHLRPVARPHGAAPPYRRRTDPCDAAATRRRAAHGRAGKPKRASEASGNGARSAQIYPCTKGRYSGFQKRSATYARSVSASSVGRSSRPATPSFTAWATTAAATRFDVSCRSSMGG